MRTAFRWWAALAACSLLAGSALADSLSDGRALYKSGQYAQAVSKLEQATREAPNDAAAWWHLNFAYNKLERYSDALAAVEKAGQLDPSHAFASDPSKYDQALQRLRSHTQVPSTRGASSSAPLIPQGSGASGGETSDGSGSDSMVRQLTEGDVYVQPGVRVDLGLLRSTTSSLRPTVVKIAILNSRANSRALDREATKIRQFLKAFINQGQGYVIVASKGGVAVSSESLSKAQLKELTDQVAPQMQAGSYSQGIANLARGLARAAAPRAASTGTLNAGIPTLRPSPVKGILVGLLVVVVVVIVIVVIVKKVRAAREMAARREPLERMRSDVVAQINYLDESVSLLGAGDAGAVREARVRAGTRVDEASKVMASARRPRDLDRAETLLDQARGDVARGRSLVDRAMAREAGDTSGSKPAAAAPGSVPPVYAEATSRETDWSSIDEHERGVCFFCSRPSRMNELTPVTVNLDGGDRKVLACEEDVATIRTGQMPQIRAFQQGGRAVPWYAAQGYDPYSDYYSRGYDNRSMLSDMIMFSMVDHMFWDWHRPSGWGWGGGYGGGGYGGGYAFYPDHSYYQDYRSTQAAGGMDYSRDVGGTDFLAEPGGGSGVGGDSGGSDFVGTDAS